MIDVEINTLTWVVAPPTYLTMMMQRTARTKVTTSDLADTDDDNAIKFNDLQSVDGHKNVIAIKDTDMFPTMRLCNKATS